MAHEVPYTILSNGVEKFHEACVNQHDKKRVGASQIGADNLSAPDERCSVCKNQLLQAPGVVEDPEVTRRDIRRAIDNEGELQGARGFPSGKTREEVEDSARNAQGGAPSKPTPPATPVSTPAPAAPKPAGVVGQPPQRPSTMPGTGPAGPSSTPNR